jgi:ABC-2 type transport system ATP-binding protein
MLDPQHPVPLSYAYQPAAPAGEVAIRVENYHKNYGDTLAVAGLSFDVRPGQILGLLGPNGAGKTTTMRAISGVIPPTGGYLLVGGYDVVREPIPAKRQLAYVPDDPHLFDALTVWEHLRFIADSYRVRDWEPRAEQLLVQFELVEKRDTMASDLSRGMRQKVAICCAYLYEPRAILFDEPLTGLDPRGIRTMKQSVRDRAAAGAAIVVSSHLLALVEDLCTHLLIMHRGRQLFCGPLAEARTAFAAGIDADASLEDVFFRATEGGPPPLSPPSGVPSNGE